MRQRSASLVAAAFAAGSFVAMSFSVVLAITSAASSEAGLLPGAFWSLPFAAMAFLGALLIWRRPANATGWVLAAAGLLMVGNAAFHDYALFAYSAEPPRFMAAASSWLAFWTWVPASQMIGVFFLLFPTGSAISRAWRPVLWGAVGVVVASAASALPTWGSRGPNILDAPTMGAVRGADLLNVLGNAGFVALVLVGLVSLVVRYRRGAGVERQQIKWLLFAAELSAGSIAFAAVMAAIERTDDPISIPAVAFGALLSSTLVPVAAGIAILRYRLYDIDVVINKTLVYGALVGFISVVYVAIVVGIGNAIGTGGEPNLGLSIAATAVVAVAFQPVRQRLQRVANRLVYGRRATPYEVVAGFGERMAGSLEVEEVLPRMAEAAARGVGAQAVRVRLVLRGGAGRSAIWPPDASVVAFDRTLPVSYRGQALGEIAVAKPRGEPLRPAEDQLLNDLAGQAGLALHNVRLTAELQARLQQLSAQAIELEASRARILSAQDDERRRLERQISAGALHELLVLRSEIDAAKALLSKDAGAAAEALGVTGRTANELLEGIRDLARGIFPPLLVDKGVSAAVEAQARKASLPVEVDADGVGRFSREAEAAVYFCILEALQNASKYAQASRATVRLRRANGDMEFEVEDDGRGFDPVRTPKGTGLQNMTDRLEALGGSVEIRSVPGRGTIVAGRVPVASEEGAG